MTLTKAEYNEDKNRIVASFEEDGGEYRRELRKGEAKRLCIDLRHALEEATK